MMVKFGSIYYAGNMLIRHLCEHDTDILFTSAFKMVELYRFIQICSHVTSKKSIVFSPLLFSGGQSINQSIHMNIFFALRMFREIYTILLCYSSPIIRKYTKALPIAIQSTKFITSFYYIYTKMDNKMKERNCVDKYRSKCKTTRRRFHGYKAEKVTTTTTQSEWMHMQDGEGNDLL